MPYGMVERQLTARTWAIGDEFSIADCVAAPALFYAGTLERFTQSHPQAAAYFERRFAASSTRRAGTSACIRSARVSRRAFSDPLLLAENPGRC